MKETILKILTVLGALIGLVLIVLIGYIVYMQLTYYRIPDNTSLEITLPAEDILDTDTAYKVLTYNIGFGAYDHDFSFFMDSGKMADGTEVSGTMSRAQSYDIALKNTQGALSVALAEEADFYLYQEVDVKATRSFKINQRSMLEEGTPGYGSVFALNFHSAYLAYPFTEPHGSVEAGLLSLSRYAISEAVRRSYPVDESFPTKFFDLDRGFTLLRLPVANSKELVLINSHMSAYDEGGTVRAAQLQMLNDVMAEEYAKGNYIIVGGDFNHALCDTVSAFPSQQQVPGWVFTLEDSALAKGLGIVRADNVTEVATCRSTDLPYTKGVNYTVVIDGFIVSDNITATAKNVDADFLYSDHNPVLLTFTLK